MRTDDPSRDAVLASLRTVLPDLRDRYHVATLEVFGSLARGDATRRSDIDLLVTFSRTPDLFTYIMLEEELSDRLGARVDLVMRRSLKPRLRDRILSEAVPV